jgi:hypothetical protein
MRAVVCIDLAVMFMYRVLSCGSYRCFAGRSPFQYIVDPSAQRMLCEALDQGIMLCCMWVLVVWNQFFAHFFLEGGTSGADHEEVSLINICDGVTELNQSVIDS